MDLDHDKLGSDGREMAGGPGGAAAVAFRVFASNVAPTKILQERRNDVAGVVCCDVAAVAVADVDADVAADVAADVDADADADVVADADADVDAED